MTRNAKRRLCGDPVSDALQAIGREGMDIRGLRPDTFTFDEQFRMVKAILHNHAFPGGLEGHVPEWRVERRIYTLDEWQAGGQRRFVQEVSAAAMGELDEVDYTEYDLSPLRRLIGNDGPILCARLAAADRTDYRLRLEAMKADLTLLGRKARGLSDVSAASEISYRIAFYEHAFEVRIRTGGRLAIWFTKGE